MAPVGAVAAAGSSAARVSFDTPSVFACGESSRRSRPCNGGIISNVCGGGKGTGCGTVDGAAVVSLTMGVWGADDNFGSGVSAAGDREAIAGTGNGFATNEDEGNYDQGNCLGKSRNG